MFKLTAYQNITAHHLNSALVHCLQHSYKDSKYQHILLFHFISLIDSYQTNCSWYRFITDDSKAMKYKIGLNGQLLFKPGKRRCENCSYCFTIAAKSSSGQSCASSKTSLKLKLYWRNMPSSHMSKASIYLSWSLKQVAKDCQNIGRSKYHK